MSHLTLLFLNFYLTQFHTFSFSQWYHYFNLNEFFFHPPTSFSLVSIFCCCYWLQMLLSEVRINTKTDCEEEENIFQGSFKCFVYTPYHLTSGSENKFNVYLHSIIVFYCTKFSLFNIFFSPPTSSSLVLCIKLPFFLSLCIEIKPQNTTHCTWSMYTLWALSVWGGGGMRRSIWVEKCAHTWTLCTASTTFYSIHSAYTSKCVYNFLLWGNNWIKKISCFCISLSTYSTIQTMQFYSLTGKRGRVREKEKIKRIKRERERERKKRSTTFHECHNRKSQHFLTESRALKSIVIWCAYFILYCLVDGQYHSKFRVEFEQEWA